MYGLIGKNLKHSFSKNIHNLFGNDNYNLFEIDSLEGFINNNQFKGINVTIPYKTQIIPYLDELDNIAKETNSVNTVINKNGKLIGYNTDYYGLKETLSFKNIEIKNKKILILGNGSVSRTVVKLMKDLNAHSIIRLCRTIKNEFDFKFSEYKKFTDYNIIINTTPVGMYPNNKDCSLLDLKYFKNLELVFDLIYNPFRTKLLIEAKSLNIKIINGLYMLVMQAKKTHELFNNIDIPLNLSNKIYRRIYHKYINYIFIGLPLSGKTKYASLLGDRLSKNVIDTDKQIETKKNKNISAIFKSDGEVAFRGYEQDIIESIYMMHNLAISTGGGMVESDYNMNLLKQNGVIVFLNKNPQAIAAKKIYNRPLLENPLNILTLAKKRLPLYIKHSDIIIDINFPAETHINEIKEKFDEYINR